MPDTLDYQPPPPPRADDPRERSASILVVGAVLGALLWALSPYVPRLGEAWDYAAYCVALFVCGLVAGCVYPRRFWLAPIGIYAGQVAYVCVGLAIGRLPPDPFLLIAACIGLALSAVALVGAAAPAAVAEVWNRRK